MEAVGATRGAENVGVGAGGVFVNWSERRRTTPFEEVEFLGGVEGVGAEDLEDERLREGKGVRVEVAGAGLGEGFGE